MSTPPPGYKWAMVLCDPNKNLVRVARTSVEDEDHLGLRHERSTRRWTEHVADWYP